MNGKLHQKSTLKVFQISPALIIEVLLPFVLGIVAIVAHARFRSHINMPGHHGLEFMALLIIAFSSSKVKWSSFLFSMGVAAFSFMPFLGFKTPLVAIIYAVPGVVFGLLSLFSFETKYKWIFFAIAGALAYGSIPLIRFIIGSITGIMHKSLISGIGFPILSFAMFGLMGSLIGLGIFHVSKKVFK